MQFLQILDPCAKGMGRSTDEQSHVAIEFTPKSAKYQADTDETPNIAWEHAGCNR